jgi:hypothetical protein
MRTEILNGDLLLFADEPQSREVCWHKGGAGKCRHPDCDRTERWTYHVQLPSATRPRPATRPCPAFDITPYLNPLDPWPKTEDLRPYAAFKHKVAGLLQPSSILEIGVRAGYSAAAFLSACPSAFYYGVDLNKDGAYGGTTGMLDYARAMLPRSFPSARLVIKEGDSRSLDSFLPSVDLAHIDGDHSFLGCLSDLYLVERSGAKWILLDDVFSHPEVRDAAAKFLATRSYGRIVFPTQRGDLLIDLATTATIFPVF